MSTHGLSASNMSRVTPFASAHESWCRFISSAKEVFAIRRTLALATTGNKRRAGAAQSVETKVGSVVPKIHDLTNTTTGERDMGDTDALADVVERTEKMAEAMVPLLDEYFSGQQAGDT